MHSTKVTYPEPMQPSGILDQYESFQVTPCIGTEFPKANLAEWLSSPNADALLRDLAITSKYHLDPQQEKPHSN